MTSLNKGRRPRGSKIRQKDSTNLSVDHGERLPSANPKPLASLRPNVILLLRHIKRNKNVHDNISSDAFINQEPHIQNIIGVGITDEPIRGYTNQFNSIDNFSSPVENNNNLTSDEDLNISLQKHNKKVRKGEVVNARCCFWDTQPFFTPPVHIPTRVSQTSIETFGWFCSPECAAAYIANQYTSNDSAHEHLTLLHYVYGPIYKNNKAFQRAPDPRQVLDCFGGAMTIEQYRETIKSGKQIQSLSTPLIKSVSEIHLVTPRTDILKPLRGKRQLVANRIYT